MNDGLHQELTKDIVELETRIDEVEERLGTLERLRERVDDLDARTDIMQLVDTSDDLPGEARSMRLLQHMQRKASAESFETIALTHDKALEALHYPDICRTTVYSDLQRCARLVDDRDICWYETADEGNIESACVVLDYDAFQEAAAAGEIDPDVVASTDLDGGA